MKLLLNLLLLVVLSGLTAAAVVSHQAADVSGIASAKDSTPVDVVDVLEQAAIKRSAPLEVSEADLNQYLAATLKGAQNGALADVTRLERALVDLEPGRARIVLCWHTSGVRTTTTLDLTCSRKGGDHRTEITGGAAGRLILMRGFLEPLLPSYRALATACEVEIKALLNMTRIEIAKDKLLLDPRY